MTSVVGSDPEGQEMMQGDWVRLAAPSSRTARDFARRVGAAYSRFPMPDEAITALSKFTDRIRKEAPKDRIRWG